MLTSAAWLEGDRLGLAAATANLRDHGVQGLPAAPRNHHGPAIGGERFRTGFADAAATAGNPGHAFPVI
jgi:hypothetical protein